MIEVYILNIEEVSTEKYHSFYLQLPAPMQKEVSKYSLEKDKYRTLGGKILLEHYLKKNTAFTLFNIKRTSYNKPYIPNSTINFNISHSSNYVVLAITQSNILGIDIEDMSYEINLNDFQKVLTDDEYHHIKGSNNYKREFYSIWTKKEAILKCEGKGFLNDISKVHLDNKVIKFQNQQYFSFSYSFNNYIISLIYQKSDIIKIFYKSYIDNELLYKRSPLTN